jgi:hypothetical protein
MESVCWQHRARTAKTGLEQLRAVAVLSLNSDWGIEKQEMNAK